MLLIKDVMNSIFILIFKSLVGVITRLKKHNTFSTLNISHACWCIWTFSTRSARQLLNICVRELKYLSSTLKSLPDSRCWCAWPWESLESFCFSYQDGDHSDWRANKKGFGVKTRFQPNITCIQFWWQGVGWGGG